MRLSFIPIAISILPGIALADPGLHDFKTVTIVPARHIASIETQDDGTDSDAPASLIIRDLVGGSAISLCSRLQRHINP